jgi:hypothetical protein
MLLTVWRVSLRESQLDVPETRNENIAKMADWLLQNHEAVV